MALVFPRLTCNFIVTGTAGNWSRVARVSGLSVKSLYTKIPKMQMSKDQMGRRSARGKNSS